MARILLLDFYALLRGISVRSLWCVGFCAGSYVSAAVVNSFVKRVRIRLLVEFCLGNVLYIKLKRDCNCNYNLYCANVWLHTTNR